MALRRCHYRIKWEAERDHKKEQPDRWIKTNGMRITYTEVGDDGIDVGDRDPTLRPKCCEG